VGVGEARGAGLLVDCHSPSIDPLVHGNMRAHIVDDLAHPRKQPGIIQHRLAHGDAVLTQLPSFAHQPGGMGQGPHRNWSIVGRHAAKFSACYEHGARTEVRSTDGGVCTRRSSADNDHIHLI
jgi:hypothetical protein